MTLFEIRAKKVVQFYTTARPAGLLAKMHPDSEALVANFVRDYEAAKAPAEALRDYHLKLAPLEAVFGRTRALAKAAVGLLEAWTLGAGNAVAVQPETGAWVLGDDEEEDLEKLQGFTAAFVRFFGAGGLPPSLQPEALRKQVAAHLKARAEMPPLPPAQQRSALQASQRDLTADCNLAFETFHDFLDGYFGKKGDAAFAQKSVYGYDRRAGRPHRKAGGAAPDSEKDAGAGKGAGPEGEKKSAPAEGAGAPAIP